MKRSSLMIVLMLAAFSFVMAQTTNKTAEPKRSKTAPNSNVIQEVMRMEDQLRKAILQHDPVMLDRVLADYYAGSFAGGESALPKKRTIEGYSNGTIKYHRIYNAKVLVFEDSAQVIGSISNKRHPMVQDADNRFRITRWWAKKDGRFQLIAEQIPHLEEEERSTY